MDRPARTSWLVAAIMAMLWPAWHGVCSARDLEAETIERMVSVGLIDAAISYVTARQELASDDPDTESAWIVRRMHILALAARQDTSRANEFVAAERNLFESFQSQHPENRRLPWLQLQVARCAYIRAQADLAAYLAAPADSNRRETVLQSLRDIAEQLRVLDRDITARLQVASREGFQGGRQAPAEQLLQLRIDAQLLECEAMLLRARAYPVESKDRIAAAGQLEVRASEILSHTDAAWNSRDRLLLARATAQLELGAAEAGLTQLQQAVGEYSGAGLGAQAALTAIEYLCHKGETSRAASVLDEMDSSSPLTEMAKIEIGLAEASLATETLRQQQLAKVIELARQVGPRHGDYWQNRADALLVGAVGGSSDGTGSNSSSNGESATALQLVRLEAKQLIAAGELELAIEKLEQRLQIDLDRKNAELSLEWATQVAALHFQTGRAREAAEVLVPVAVQFAESPSADLMHRNGLAYMQVALAANMQDTELAAAYERGLKIQLNTWPESDATRIVADWLSRWLIGKRRTRELLDLLHRWAEQATNTNIAREVVQDVWWRWLTVFADSPKSVQLDALGSLQEKATDNDAATVVRGFASLLASWVNETVAGTYLRDMQQAAKRLDGATPSRVDAHPWEQLVKAAEILVAARLQDMQRCEAASGGFSIAELPASLSRMVVRGVAEAIDFTEEAERDRWCRAAGFDASLSSLMLDSSLPGDRAIGYRLMAWTGDRFGGGEGLRGLQRQTPRDANVILHLAQHLAEDRGEARDESTRLARVVAANSPPVSENHLTAQWRRLRNLQLSGESSSAARGAELLLATSPPSDSIWLARFRQIADNKR